MEFASAGSRHAVSQSLLLNNRVGGTSTNSVARKCSKRRQVRPISISHLSQLTLSLSSFSKIKKFHPSLCQRHQQLLALNPQESSSQLGELLHLHFSNHPDTIHLHAQNQHKTTTMSLKEAYQLAHSAQCRLQMSASAPNRNLRFVVGHLMHYENLRLRIVEMEHAVDKSPAASAVKFRGTGHHEVGKKPSTGQLGGRKSPPPPAYDPYADDEVNDADPWSGGEDDEEEAGDDLGLQRFPSGSARPPQPPPDLIPDEEASDEEDEEPVSPEEPDEETLERLLRTEGSKDLANMYEGVRKCPCHRHQDAPSFEKMWELPSSKEGVTRAVAQVYV